VDNLPEGTIIDRMPGYLVLARPVKLVSPGAEFELAYDPARLDGDPDRRPRACRWRPDRGKWVALATYPAGEGRVRVINDGNYSGWFAVFGVRQPHFTDVTGHWAERIADRMNGLGLLEGYPNPADPAALSGRPAGLDRIVTRAEASAVAARVLGLTPGDTLYDRLWYPDREKEARALARFADADAIPAWCRPYVAALADAGLAQGKPAAGGRVFDADEPITRVEAAAIASRALAGLPGAPGKADLSRYKDAEKVPAWAKEVLLEGVLTGYPDGTLRPEEPMPRAEFLAVMLRLLRGLGW
jgi:hypothetical protein